MRNLRNLCNLCSLCNMRFLRNWHYSYCCGFLDGQHRCSLFTAYYCADVPCVLYMTSWQPVQVLYQCDSTGPGLWLLVFLHVGETSEKAVGPALEDINPALNPKNSDQADF